MLFRPEVVRSLLKSPGRISKLVTGKLLRIRGVRLTIRVARKMGNDDATHMAAGVAYYGILSLFPLTIVLIFVFSLILDPSRVEDEMIRFFQTYLPGIEEVLGDNIESVDNVKGVLGIVSFAGLLWTASALFGAISRAINRAWNVHSEPPFYIAKARHIAMSMGVGLLFLLSLGATSFLQFLGGLGLDRIYLLDNIVISISARLLPFVFTLGIFLMVYKYVPNTVTHWRHIWPGALLGAIIFEIAKSVFVFYLGSFADYAKIYGSLGAVVAFMGWIYISSFILIAGAEFSCEYERMQERLRRGQLRSPAS